MNINGSYLFVKKKIVKKINIEEKIIEPIAPEIVFFGLIFVSLVPLNHLPITKPPMSENTSY